MSKDDLKELFKALSPPATLTHATQSTIETDQNAEQRKREVREWMQKKKEERMREYRTKKEELRAGEKHPFQSTNRGPRQVHLSVGN
jgi:Joubert syndrome-associated